MIISKNIKFRIPLTENEVIDYWKKFAKECLEAEGKEYSGDNKLISTMHRDMIVTTNQFYKYSKPDHHSRVRVKNVLKYKCCFVIGLNPFEVQPNENKFIDRKDYLFYDNLKDNTFSLIETSIDNLDIFNKIMSDYNIRLFKTANIKTIPLEFNINPMYEISMNRCCDDEKEPDVSYYIKVKFIEDIGEDCAIKNKNEAFNFLTNLPIIKNHFDIRKIDLTNFDE